MKYKVYVETSFISYLVGRLKTDLITLQRQLSSQLWWQRKRNEFQLFASQAVYRECIRGTPRWCKSGWRFSRKLRYCP